MIDAQAITDAARECIDTPWRHQGRKPGVGLDCIGLLRWPAVRNNYVMGDYTRYGLEPDIPLILRILSQYMDHVGDDELVPGNAVQMYAAEDLHPQHFGVLTTDGKIVHAIRKHGVIEHRFVAPFPDRIFRVWRYREH